MKTQSKPKPDINDIAILIWEYCPPKMPKQNKKELAQKLNELINKNN